MTEKKDPTKSPSLADVSHRPSISEASAETAAEAERRRMPRLNLTSEQFRLGLNGKVFSVVDLSAGGMALRVLDQADLLVFTLGAEIDGILNLHREKHRVKARVRHVGRELVGCQFESVESATREALDRLLDPQVLGQELRPIPASDNGTLWFHGPSGTDLILWRGTDGQYRRIALFVLGSYAQWEKESGVTTGRSDHSFEKSELRGALRFETMLLVPDSKADPGKLKIAKTLLLSSNLPQDLQAWCIQQLGIPQ